MNCSSSLMVFFGEILPFTSCRFRRFAVPGRNLGEYIEVEDPPGFQADAFGTLPFVSEKDGNEYFRKRIAGPGPLWGRGILKCLRQQGSTNGSSQSKQQFS